MATLWTILTKLFATAAFGTVFCVVDGLDECEEGTRRVLLSRMFKPSTDKGSTSGYVLKLVLLSREITGLCSCTRINLSPDNEHEVASDIELSVADRVSELSSIEGFDHGPLAAVQKELLKRAEETFLWVGFAMFELLRQCTPTDVWSVLEDLPSGLTAMYNRMLQQIPAQRRQLSVAILRWVLLSARPLKLHELAAAVGLKPITSSITIEQAIRDAIKHCDHLLPVQPQNASRDILPKVKFVWRSKARATRKGSRLTPRGITVRKALSHVR